MELLQTKDRGLQNMIQQNESKMDVVNKRKQSMMEEMQRQLCAQKQETQKTPTRPELPRRSFRMLPYTTLLNYNTVIIKM